MKNLSQKVRTAIFEENGGLLSTEQFFKIFNLIYNSPKELDKISSVCEIHPQKCRYVLDLLNYYDIIDIFETYNAEGEIDRRYEISNTDAIISIVPESDSETMAYLLFIKEVFDNLIMNSINSDSSFTIDMTKSQLQNQEIGILRDKTKILHKEMSDNESYFEDDDEITFISILGKQI